ncbi:hypothetical protein ACFY97_18795 [Streptomyces klenkii]|uniref:hypothetical protein n=1 Tax=Streptomyces klenkii TaxID=1420899 RepID=UPI0036F0EC5D
MPSLPAGLQTVTVTGTYRHPDGAPFTGHVSFLPEPAVLTSPQYDTIVLGEVTTTPDSNGHIAVTLLATDATGVTPTGWTYRVTERWYDAHGRSYPISLPAAAPNVDLADVAPTAPAAGEYVVVTGPPGPPGPPGSSGSTYLHTQSTPAATWQITHNLGRTPNINVINSAGVVVYADILHSSTSLATITFPVPFAGTAMCS